MNHYDMESNSRMENLVAFKTVYGNSMRMVAGCLEKFFPYMTADDRQAEGSNGAEPKTGGVGGTK